MILVTLGTQDKSFTRLLDAIQKQIEDGRICERVVVQAGFTKYQSSQMEIFDYIERDAFDKLLLEADCIVTHGGVGTIMTALKAGKKVIGVARLAQFNEHHNDHQMQILESFAQMGYLLHAKDTDEIGSLIEQAKQFSPKPIQSNTKNFIKMLEDFMDKN